MINVNAPALLDTVSKLARTASAVQSKSLIEFTGSTRITPLTIIDRSLLTLPELPDILQIDTSLYSGYYLMGVQLNVNSINGISVLRQLDKLSPNRRGITKGDVGMAALNTAQSLARENYTYRLPMGDKPLKPLVYPTSLGTESADGTDAPKRLVTLATEAKSAAETITEDNNLAVGKLIELDLTICGQKVKIPVNVRLNTFNASPANIVNIVANIDPRQSASEVKALYQAGLIDLWDALTSKSAVNEWRKAAVQDPTGIILREQQRRSGNKLSAVLSGEASIGDISGIYVISHNTAKMIEGEIGGKLSDFRVREKMLAKTGVMLLTVVNTDWKSVTIYHHSIDGASSYSFADLKRGGKSNNHDIGMVLEAFRQGQAPAKFF